MQEMPDAARATFSARLFNQSLKVYIEPEVDARIRAGLAAAPIELPKFQVISFLDDRPTEIRLNDDAKIEALIELTDPTLYDRLERGNEYLAGELPGRLDRLQLGPGEDPDAAHISAASWSDGWHIAIDTRYNRGKAAPLVATARQFIETARHAREHGRWAPFVDNMHSAIELAVKATLWTGPFGRDFQSRMPHGDIDASFYRYARAGNVTPAQRKVFEELRKTRNPARYVYERNTENWKAADRWVAELGSMLAVAIGWWPIPVLTTATGTPRDDQFL